MAADSAGQLKSKGSGQSRLLERDLCYSLFVVHCSLLSMFIAVDVVVRSMEADERRRSSRKLDRRRLGGAVLVVLYLLETWRSVVVKPQARTRPERRHTCQPC